jgi:DNA-binding GntR family transcriptional regulator
MSLQQSPPSHLADNRATAASLRPKRASPRRERVLEALREAIVVGRYEDGDRLIEDRIARELSTSRGPVREALRQLEHEGLVVSYPYRGAVVQGVSDEEVHEVLIPIRLTLERFSFTKAVERMADPDYAELAKEVWLMREAAAAGDLLRCVEADIRFHEFVLSCSGQPHTTQVWRSIAPRIRAYFFRYGRHSDLGIIAVEHEQLLGALRSGDHDRLMKALERHIAVRTPTPS